MVDTYIVWKIPTDLQVCEMVHELETNCNDNLEWSYMMNQIMEWARQKLLEVQDNLFFIFEEIYYSNWEDAEHTTVQIIVENDLSMLVITSQSPGVNWENHFIASAIKRSQK
jgi:hypothetical protein